MCVFECWLKVIKGCQWQHLCVSLSAAEETMEIISRLCVGMMDVLVLYRQSQ